jgi:murein DD-endopeptidase MepM/ murein hydrolase activator NlpD
VSARLLIPLAAAVAWAGCGRAASPPVRAAFEFPTPNRALLDPGGEDRFFVGTTGRPWTSGTFGCVRSEGWQMHEGLDIRSVERDGRGEALDAITATADGSVAYINRNPGLSNYGIYVVLRHHVDGVEIYSLYAHLAGVKDGLTVGQDLRAGESFARMGRTANTREGISKDRAHLHFELCLLVNPRYPEWFRRNAPGQTNGHGVWNGQNLLGIDPRLVLLSGQRYRTNFNLARFLTVQPELCRVTVRSTNFPWLTRYPSLIRPGAAPADQPLAGYEIHLDYNGVPVRLLPRSESQMESRESFHLVSVNEAEYGMNPCRRLVVRAGKRFELGAAGIRLLQLLTF